MAVNDFLTFCPLNTGTNLPTQSEYYLDQDRESGQKTGIASSKLNNKALRQANVITSQLAQLVCDRTGLDMFDDGILTNILANLNAALPSGGPTALSAALPYVPGFGEIPIPSNSFTVANNTGIAVTNLNVTLVTTGRPVWVGLVADKPPAGQVAGYYTANKTTIATTSLNTILSIYRGANEIFYHMNDLTSPTATALTLNTGISVYFTIDIVAAGTQTYSIKMSASGQQSSTLYNARLFAYQI